MAYMPFPILGFETGKAIHRAPWLVPSDAFPVLSNGRIIKQVLEKRLGYTLLDSTGAGQPIMGIFEARYNGVPRILVLDTKRVYSYDLTAGTLTDLSGANTFTGGDYDFWRFCTYYSKTYFANGITADGIRSWDEATDTLASVSTAGAVTIQTCRGMFMLKSRLHFISPTIGDVFYPGRNYYTDVGTTTITNATQYYTYERDDVPVNYKAVDMNNILIMGRKSSWRVEYTGDSTTPFRCVTVDEVFPCLTPHVAIEYRSPTTGRMIAMLSNRHFVAWDGYQYHRIDWPIRDLVDEMAVKYLHYSQGCKLAERDALYLTYPETGQQYPNRVLEYSVDDNAWSHHTITMHCLASVSGEVSPSDYSFNEGTIGRSATGYTLGGDTTGNLYRMDYGGSDNGANIALEVRSAALNPFEQERRKAYLGWVEFYCDTDSTATFTVYFYKDDDTTSYKDVAVSCDGSGDRFWQKIVVGGELGSFHRIRIANDAQDNRPRIHAIVPWFERAGRISTDDTAADWPDMTWRLHAEGGLSYIQRKESGVWVSYQTWGA